MNNMTFGKYLPLNSVIHRMDPRAKIITMLIMIVAIFFPSGWLGYGIIGACVFFLLTKRPQRVKQCLPFDWGDGWDNVFFNVTCENQQRADERIPIMLELPFKHKGIMCAPLIGPISIEKYLVTGQIERVKCGGENYDGSRPCHFEWVTSLQQECINYNVTFCFIETGTVFVKDGKTYRMPDKRVQSEMAYKSGVNFKGKPMEFALYDNWNNPIPQEQRHIPQFRKQCYTCGRQMICNGCSNCGKCEKPKC